MWRKQTGSRNVSEFSDAKVTLSKKRYVSLSQGISEVLEFTRSPRAQPPARGLADVDVSRER
jgi:hypothetical protein